MSEQRNESSAAVRVGPSRMPAATGTVGTREGACHAPAGYPSIAFTVYGVAQPAGSKKAFRNRHTDRIHIVDDAKKSRPWKQEVSEAALYARPTAELLEGPLQLDLVFYVSRPKGHYGTGRNATVLKPSAAPFPTVKPDVLKLARAVEDALTGILYRDDAQIVTELLRKRYGDPARVDIRVRPVTEETLVTHQAASQTRAVEEGAPA